MNYQEVHENKCSHNKISSRTWKYPTREIAITHMARMQRKMNFHTVGQDIN